MSFTSFYVKFLQFGLVWLESSSFDKNLNIFLSAQHWAEVMIRVQVEEAIREEADFWIWFDHFIDLIRFPNVHVGAGYRSFLLYIYLVTLPQWALQTV